MNGPFVPADTSTNDKRQNGRGGDPLADPTTSTLSRCSFTGNDLVNALVRNTEPVRDLSKRHPRQVKPVDGPVVGSPPPFNLVKGRVGLPQVRLTPDV